MDTFNIYVYVVNAKSAIHKRLQRLEDAWADADRVLSALQVEGFSTEAEALREGVLVVGLAKGDIEMYFIFDGDGKSYEYTINDAASVRVEIGEPFPAELLGYLGVDK